MLPRRTATFKGGCYRRKGALRSHLTYGRPEPARPGQVRGKFRVARVEQERRGELEARDPRDDTDLTPGIPPTGSRLGREGRGKPLYISEQMKPTLASSHSSYISSATWARTARVHADTVPR